MQPFRMQGILIFCLIFVSTVIEGQLDFDCRRNKVTCFGDTPTVDHCSLQTGDCICPNGTEGYNCGLDTSNKADAGTCSKCLNGATCTKDDRCYCNSNTYGPTCQNFRVAVWCTDVEMFISVNPEVDVFSGALFVSAEDITDARNNPKCSLLEHKFAANTTVPDWVTVANGGVADLTGLQGFFLQIDHNTAANLGTTSECGRAVVTEGENGSKSYTRRVAIEYNSNLLTSLDQMLNVVCTLQNTADLKTNSSFTAVIANNNYQQVNISDTIEPVSFEILDAANKPITSDIHLGDQVNLKFTVISPTYTALKVKECNATNGQVGGTAQINFLKNDCPVFEWGALFRGDVLVRNDTEKSSTVPLSAFRFNGNISTVMFVCSLQLCTEANGDACTRSPCGAASNTPAVTQSPTQAPEVPTVQPATEAPTADNTTQASGRRKRASGLQEQAQLSKSVQVLAGDETSSVQGTPSTVSDKDCMEHNEVVVIIVTFSMALALMLILIVVLVIQRLRSRFKVVDASDMASADSHSHYSLPRLSVANF